MADSVFSGLGAEWQDPTHKGDEAVDTTANNDDLEQFRLEIARVYQFHADAFHAGDSDRLVEAFFTEDAVWTGPGFPDAVGHKALKAMFAGVVGKQQVSFVTDYAAVYGDVGWTIATYPVIPRDVNAVPFVFRPLFVWVRREGNWRCASVCSFTK